MSDEMEDLFGDDDEDQQQQEHDGNVLQDEDAAAQQAADEEVDYAAGLEDDMDDAAAAAAAAAGGDAAGGLGADEERELFGGLEDDDDEDAAAAGPQEERGPPIDVHAPLLPRPAADSVVLLKVPNILRIEPRPYDPALFEEGAEEIMDPNTGVVKTRPRDINVVRWRLKVGEDGQLTRESNARYVKWSDGSESIVLGDEVLNVTRQQHAKSHSYLYAVRYDVIEGQAHLNTRMTVAPANINSKLHKRLKMTVAHASRRVDKVRLHYAAKNPELEKIEIEKRAEEQARLKAARERSMPRPAAPKRRNVYTAAYLEEEDEFAGGGGDDLGYDEEDEAGGAAAADDDELYRRRPADREEEEAAERRLRVAKRTTPPPRGSSSRKRGYDSEEEEAEEEEAPADKAAPGIKVRRGAILDDDDD
ncbi:hypothetical protein OEZ85_000598 [Tetradesmus obliquus]|uniref:RNA polymerase-associated protein LEO1 n=1 Tax=Tetradesmus obliquus TaxID=3088 RepID=A0ABY8UJS5_TETOB|nr:hypothetical protein OEZ85_000598 [Tetradesmus obliquus]